MRLVLALIPIVVLCIYTGCSPGPGKELHLIIPTEFRGPIVMIFENEKPVKVASSTIIIPSSGLIRLHDAHLAKWTRVSAAYASGEKIIVEVHDTNGEEPAPDDFVLRFAGSAERNGLQEFWLAFGTLDDEMMAKERMRNYGSSYCDDLLPN